MYAVLRIRGSVNTSPGLKATMKMLKLDRVNHCVIVPKNESYEGMLKKARDYVTWGEIDKNTLEKLVAKRGRLPGNRKLDEKQAKETAKKILGKGMKDAGIKSVFRLSPPSHGYRSIRTHYPKGDLGNRGEKINLLIKKMI